MVRVIQGTIWAPKPGRGVEMVGQMAVAKKIHERLGATVRAWQVVAGGTGSLQAIYSLVYDDWNAFVAYRIEQEQLSLYPYTTSLAL